MRVSHYKFDRITLEPGKCSGKPCIRGLRIPVQSVLTHLGSGMSVEQILQEWPELEQEDIHQALAYASEAVNEEVFLAVSTAAA